MKEKLRQENVYFVFSGCKKKFIVQISGHKSKQFVERAKAESTPMLGRAQDQEGAGKIRTKRGWKTGEERHSAYICTDGLRVKVASRAFKRD